VETLRRGYDRFVILGGEAQTETRLLGYTPTRCLHNWYGDRHSLATLGVIK
jgi:hypothetical protein